MGPVEALQLALEKELEAKALYEKLGKQHKIAEDVFNFLLEEETKHQRLIEKKIQELTTT